MGWQRGRCGVSVLLQGRCGDERQPVRTSRGVEAVRGGREGIWLFANQIAGVLEAIIDAAVLAGITAAAGTILIETGVGAIVGYGLAALEIARIIELIGKAGTIIQTAGTVILGIAGAIIGLARQGGDLKVLTLPGGAYDHPAVAQ